MPIAPARTTCCVISNTTFFFCECLGRLTHDRSFENMVLHNSLTLFASMLRSLARNAACNSESAATGCGLGCLPGRCAPASAAALPSPLLAAVPPFPLSAGTVNFLGLPSLSTASEHLPTQSWRRRLPLALQAANMELMSACCFQFPFLPGRTGDHFTSP